MATVIRLARKGRTHRAYYRVMVADSKYKPEGKFLEQVGTYDPHQNPPLIKLNESSIINWMNKGATASETVHAILLRNGVMEKFQQVKSGKSLEEATGTVKEWKEPKAKPNRKALAKVKEEEEKAAAAKEESEKPAEGEAPAEEASAEAPAAEEATAEAAPAEAAPAEEAPAQTTEEVPVPQSGRTKKKASKKEASDVTEEAPKAEAKAETNEEDAPKGTKKKASKKEASEVTVEAPKAEAKEEAKAEASEEEAPKGTKKKAKKADD